MSRSPFLGIACLLALGGCAIEGDDTYQNPFAPDFVESGEIRDGWVDIRWSPEGEYHNVYWRDMNGTALIEGDIAIGKTDEIARRSNVDVFAGKWPGALVPWVIQGGMPNQWRMTDAMDSVEARTGVNFQPRSGQFSYISWIQDSGCWSYVGMIGGQQQIGMANACYTGEAMHEAFHALGSQHEQSRPDRNSHVTVYYNCIQNGAAGNFNIANSDRPRGPYEARSASIMHYGSWFFSNGCATILTTEGFSITPNTTGLTGYDADAMAEHYGFNLMGTPVQIYLRDSPGINNARAYGYSFNTNEKAYLVSSDNGVATPGEPGGGVCHAAIGGQCLSIQGSLKVLATDFVNTYGEAAFTYDKPANVAVGDLGMIVGAKRGVGGASSVFSDGHTFYSHCASGWTRDCNNTCVNINQIGNNICNANLDCSFHRNDGGDC